MFNVLTSTLLIHCISSWLGYIFSDATSLTVYCLHAEATDR